jgi:hypothetical protein
MWAASLAAFFYCRPHRAFPCGNGRLVAFDSASFRFLVAPTQLVQEFADVIAMVLDAQSAFNQRGDSLRSPQLRTVAVGHCALCQQLEQFCFLPRAQFGRSAGGWLGFQRFYSTGTQGVAPAKDATGVAPDPAGYLMQRQLLPQQCDDAVTTLRQRFRRTMRSHRGTSFQDASMILHYLCGSQ